MNLNGNYARAMVAGSEELGLLESMYWQADRLMEKNPSTEEVDQAFLAFLVQVPPRRRRAVLRRFHRLAQTRLGIEKTVVTLADPISQEQSADLITRLEKQLGKRLSATIKIEPNILGGMQVLAGYHLYDESIQTQMKQLNANMKEVLMSRARR